MKRIWANVDGKTMSLSVQRPPGASKPRLMLGIGHGKNIDLGYLKGDVEARLMEEFIEAVEAEHEPL